MQNKAPQGKQDPIPTPESELEQYGVWVKAEPQDVVDEPGTGKPTSTPDLHDSKGHIFLSEEENLVDSFEFDESITDEIEELEALSPVDALENNAELPEDLAAFDLETLENIDLEPFSEPLSEDFPENAFENAALDITIDELDNEQMPEEPGSMSFDTTDISMEDFGLSDSGSTDPLLSLDNFNPGAITTQNPEISHMVENSATEDFETFDMDLQFDDTIPADDSIESSDVFTSADESSIDASSNFESVDLESIGLEKASGDIASPSVASVAQKLESSTAESSNISMDSFIDFDDSDAPGIMPDMELENVSLNDEPTGFDDVQAVSDDLSTKVTEPSSDLLQKIVLELSSIKEELVSLRGQLSSLKTTNQAIQIAEEEQEISEEGAPGGFFDEEDDDTIALTGDELDNILNTADFTEEIADNDSFDEHTIPVPEIQDSIELLPEDGVYEAVGLGIETIELPTITPTQEEFESISAQEGVTPITNLPEDTSFLDVSEEQISLELEMPLEDVPLVEPDSSDLDSIIGSAFDNENTEFADLEIQAEEFESEIVLDFDSDDEPVISTVDSFPEPLDEIEDALELEEFVGSEDLGGLELLAEESELEELEEISLDEEDSTAILDDSEILEAIPEELESLSSPDGLDSALPSANQPSDLFFETPPFDEIPEIMESYLEPEATLLTKDLPVTEADVDTVNTSKKLDAVPVMEAVSVDTDKSVPDKLKHDVKSVLLYLDQLLASLPEEKIEEFASSEYYDTYKRLFDDLGLL